MSTLLYDLGRWCYRHHRRVLVIWLAAMLYLTWIIDERTRGCDSACLSSGARFAQALVYLGALWIVGVGIWRTFRGDPHDSPDVAAPA